MSTTTSTCFRIVAVTYEGREMIMTFPYADLEALLRHADLRVEGWYTDGRRPNIDYLQLEDDSTGDWKPTLRDHVVDIGIDRELISWALELAS